MPHLARIVVYPVKSLDGTAVPTAPVLPSGALAWDRRYAIVDGEGRIVNANRLAAIHRLRSRFDIQRGMLSLVSPWRRGEFHVDSQRGQVEAWLTDFLGFAVTLAENADVGFPDDLDSPGPTVVGKGTIEAVAGWFEGLTPDDVRRRFRANLELDTLQPFWEDRLFARAGEARKFRIGATTFAGTNPCQRCVVPTRSPDDGNPLADFAATFTRRRRETLPEEVERSRFDHYYRLSVNTRLVEADPHGLRVGDEVELMPA